MIITKNDLPKQHNYFVKNSNGEKIVPIYLINLSAKPTNSEIGWNEKDVTCIFFVTNSDFNFHPIGIIHYENVKLDDLRNIKFHNVQPEDIFVFRGKLEDITDFKSKFNLHTLSR